MSNDLKQWMIAEAHIDSTDADVYCTSLQTHRLATFERLLVALNEDGKSDEIAYLMQIGITHRADARDLLRAIRERVSRRDQEFKDAEAERLAKPNRVSTVWPITTVGKRVQFVLPQFVPVLKILMIGGGSCIIASGDGVREPYRQHGLCGEVVLETLLNVDANTTFTVYIGTGGSSYYSRAAEDTSVTVTIAGKTRSLNALSGPRYYDNNTNKHDKIHRSNRRDQIQLLSTLRYSNTTSIRNFRFSERPSDGGQNGIIADGFDGWSAKDAKWYEREDELQWGPAGEGIGGGGTLAKSDYGYDCPRDGDGANGGVFFLACGI